MKKYILKTVLCFTTAYLSACGATDPIDSNSDLATLNVKRIEGISYDTLELRLKQGNQIKFEKNVYG